jgi:hypothetical protein
MTVVCWILVLCFTLWHMLSVLMLMCYIVRYHIVYEITSLEFLNLKPLCILSISDRCTAITKQPQFIFFVTKTNQMHCVHTAVGVYYMFKVTGSWSGRDRTVFVMSMLWYPHHTWPTSTSVQQNSSILTWPAASHLKPITQPNCCTYTVNSSWWWARNMPKTCRR